MEVAPALKFFCDEIQGNFALPDFRRHASERTSLVSLPNHIQHSHENQANTKSKQRPQYLPHEAEA